MPTDKPDRDDGRGNLAGRGGPQDGPLNGAGAGEGGAGSQRHDGGSSRDNPDLGR